MGRLNIRQKEILFSLFILVTVVIFHRKSFFLPPISTHAWAMADWYALALGFLDNGFDFFHPQVNQLNLQFPAQESLENLQGITAVDFPINPFIVAILMKIFGTTSPIIYRAYTLTLSLIGLYFLFKTVEARSNSFLLSALIVSFIHFQPTYAYYMDGMLPTQNALSFFFIGTFFLNRYHLSQKTVWLIITLLFYTLAALIRLPFSIPLIALGGSHLLINVENKKIVSLRLILVSISLLPIFIYFIYNKQLAESYGSVFLNHIMPPRSLSELLRFWVIGFGNNLRHVLPLPHLFILALSGFIIWKSSTKTFFAHHKPDIIFWGLTLLGGFMYAFLMTRQLKAHDYYYNDFLIPGVILFLIWASGLDVFQVKSNSRSLLAGLFILAGLNIAFESQSRHFNEGFGESPEVECSLTFEGSDVFLDKNNVPKDAKILVIDCFSPSVPANNFRRKTFIIRTIEAEAVARSFNWKFDYIVVPSKSIHQLQYVYPSWNKKVQRVDKNEKLSLFRLK